MRVGGQRHAPAALLPGMTRFPLYRRLGRPQDRCGRVLKISPPPGFDHRTVQLVASRYIEFDKICNQKSTLRHIPQDLTQLAKVICKVFMLRVSRFCGSALAGRASDTSTSEVHRLSGRSESIPLPQ
jgi:hypothetical protein